MQPPILMAVPGVPAGIADPEAAKRAVYARLAVLYEDLLRTPGLAAVERASLVRQLRAANAIARRQPLELVRER